MRIRDLLAAESIELNGSAAGKQDVLNKMVDLMAKSGKIRDVETYRKGVFAREEEGTTGIGEGIAIPHCKSDAVKAPGLAAMVVKDGVEFDALDGAPVNLLFLIAGGAQQTFRTSDGREFYQRTEKCKDRRRILKSHR